jgi:hypothetical protein
LGHSAEQKVTAALRYSFMRRHLINRTILCE